MLVHVYERQKALEESAKHTAVSHELSLVRRGSFKLNCEEFGEIQGIVKLIMRICEFFIKKENYFII
jgi:hypothetical protein